MFDRLANDPPRSTRWPHWPLVQALPSFGVRVGLLGKTFVVVRGENRKRVSLGKYPKTSLQEAR